jgi:hypothetical protein
MVRHRAVTLLAVAVIGLSGCGGDDDSETSAEQDTTTTPSGTGPSGGDKSPAPPDEKTPPQSLPGSVGDEEDEGDAASEGDDDGDSEDVPSTAVGIDPGAASEFRLGTPLREVLDELGAEPLGKRPGPAGTTCYEFGVRPARKNAPPVDRRLRAQFCFRGGKLRGSGLVNRPLPSSG